MHDAFRQTIVCWLQDDDNNDACLNSPDYFAQALLPFPGQLRQSLIPLRPGAQNVVAARAGSVIEQITNTP
jgi:hypothetical protein